MRRQYDQFGHAAFDGGAGGAGGFDFSGMDMGDIFGDIFGDFFGGGRRNSNNNGPAQGASVRLTVRITFEEAVFGCSKELEFPYKEECKTCHGTGAKPGTSPETCSKCGGKGKVVYSQQSLFGMMQNVQTCPDCGGTGKVIREKCPDCRGTGYISKKVRKTVEIPAGIDNGQSVRVRGYGEPGRNGGPRGDLLVEVLVSRSNAFERQDMNIFPMLRFPLVLQHWAGYPYQDGGRRYHLYRCTGYPERNENPPERQRSTIDPKQGSTWRPLCNTDCQHADGLKQRGKRGVA